MKVFGICVLVALCLVVEGQLKYQPNCWRVDTYWRGPGCCGQQKFNVKSRAECAAKCLAQKKPRTQCEKVTYWEIGAAKHCRLHSNGRLDGPRWEDKMTKHRPPGAQRNKVWAAVRGCTGDLSCGAGKYFAGGKCAACPPGKICAGGVGAAATAKACGAGKVCSGGVEKACGAGKVCSGGAEKACGAGKVCSGGVEKACGAGKVCSGGVEKACGAGKVCTGGVEKACGAGKLCTGGVEKACPADNLCANGAAKACFGGSKRASGASKCTKTVECTTAKCTC